MHEGRSFVVDLAIVLCVAAVITVLFRKLRQPVVLGYLLAGLIVGPHIPIPVFADLERVRVLSELGVIFLMFSIGLEFGIRRLLRLGITVSLIGVLQISAMIWLGYLVGRIFGWTGQESFFAGAMIAISSTTIIAKAFAERGVGGRLAELVYGVLIVEDLAAILLLAIAPAVLSSGDIPAGELAAGALKLLGFLIGIVVAGFLVVPRSIRLVAKLGNPEALLVASVGVCFGLALVAQELGYSVALGAFLAGSLIDESGHSEAVKQLVAPLRDVFAAVFFVSVGMLFDPAAFLDHWPAVLLFTVVVIVGKMVSVASGAVLVGVDLRTSVRAGMSLGQIGEFSFLIAAAAIATKTIGEFLYPVAIAVSVLTTFTTPWLIGASDRMASWVDRRLPHRVQTFLGLYGTWLAALRSRKRDEEAARSAFRRAVGTTLIDVAVIAIIVIATSSFADELVAWLSGFGLEPALGQAVVLIGALLLSVPFFIGLFRSTGALGMALAVKAFPVPEGRADTAAAPRKALLIAIRLAILLIVGTLLLAVTQPFVPAPYGALVVLVALLVVGVAFWRSTRELHEHVRAGAQVVLEALSRQGGPLPSPEPLESVESLLPGFGRVTAVRLSHGDPAVGKTLTQLDLRSLTGATVVAIAGRPEGIVAPSGRETLRAGDILAVVGRDEAIRAARGLLCGE